MLSAALFFSGCSKTKSENVKTDGIYAEFELVGNNKNSIICSATLKVGGSTGTVIDLSNGDVLTCDGYPMDRSEDLLGVIRYQVQLSYQKDKVYNIVFHRPEEKPYVASVIVPELIKGLNPLNGAIVKKGTNIDVIWTISKAAGDSFSTALNFAESSGNGQHPEELYEFDSYPENGYLEFQSSGLFAGEADKGIKPATVFFTRYHYGQMPSLLKGVITASQKTSVAVKFVD